MCHSGGLRIRLLTVSMIPLAFLIIPLRGVLSQDTAAGSSSRSLSLNEATNLAILNSPEVRQISWNIEKTIADGVQQSRRVNPQVGSMANEIGNDGQAGQYGLFLQRNLVRNHRFEQIQHAYQWQARSLQSVSLLRQRQIALRIARIFIDIGLLQQQLRLAQAKQQELTDLRQIVESLVKGGEIGSLDLTQVELELATHKQAIGLLRIELENLEELLRSHTGQTAAVNVDFRFTEEVALVLGSGLEREVPLDDHPAVVQITDQIESQRWKVQAAMSQQRPDWQVQTSINYDAGPETFFGGFQVNIPWQINNRQEGQISSAQAEVNLLNETRQQVRLKLERRLIELAGRRKSLVQEIQSIQQNILPKVDRATAQTVQLFQAGETDFRNVKSAILQKYQWRERQLDLARDLLLVEAETETLPMDETPGMSP